MNETLKKYISKIPFTGDDLVEKIDAFEKAKVPLDELLEESRPMEDAMNSLTSFLYSAQRYVEHKKDELDPRCDKFYMMPAELSYEVAEQEFHHAKAQLQKSINIGKHYEPTKWKIAKKMDKIDYGYIRNGVLLADLSDRTVNAYKKETESVLKSMKRVVDRYRAREEKARKPYTPHRDALIGQAAKTAIAAGVVGYVSTVAIGTLGLGAKATAVVKAAKKVFVG